MKKIKYILKVLTVLMLTVLPISCDYLEYDEDKAWTDELVWTEYAYVKRYLASIYDKVPSTFDYVDGAFLASTTDDAEHSGLFSNVERFNTGSLSSFDHPNGAWDKNYEGIRLADSFIKNSDTLTLYKDINNIEGGSYSSDSADLVNWRGEARFLKALFYFELIKRYGSVPIVEEWKDEDTPLETSKKSFAEVVDFIGATCDEALKFLPVKSELDTDEIGHATKGAAYALKARAFLYAASKQHNPDGENDAYYDSCVVNASKLFNMNYAVSGVNYSNIFTPGNNLHFTNNDVIFDIRGNENSNAEKNKNKNQLEKDNYPVGFDMGKGFTNPTQDLVDCYETKNGYAVTLTENGFISDDPAFDSENPYANRDPRFAATIIYNGFNMTVGNADKAREVETFNGGFDGPVQKDIIGTRTGYYLKKYIDTDLDLQNGDASKHFWFVFRYAEVLLNYAEAMNELHGPDADPEGYGKTAREAINEVRGRAGMPDVVAADADEFSEKLRKERRVELAFEDHRHWDVRRWKIAEDVLNQPVHGVSIVREEGERIARDEDNDDIQDKDEEGNLLWDIVYEYTYTKKVVEERVFESHMELYPIPRSEVFGGVNIPQNTGW